MRRLQSIVVARFHAAWDAPVMRSVRRRWRRRRAYARIAHLRLRRHPVSGPALRCGEAYWTLVRPWLARGADLLHRIATPAGRALGRFLAAHREAWIWLGAGLARWFRRRGPVAETGGDTQITGVVGGQGDTMATGALVPGAPNCLFACAICAHESMIVGARKYDAFRCPECGTALMVIEAERGLTMVSPAPAAHGRVRAATRAETIETEVSLPVVAAKI